MSYVPCINQSIIYSSLQVDVDSRVPRSRRNRYDVSNSSSLTKSNQQNISVSRMPSSNWFANAFMKVYAHEDVVQTKYNLKQFQFRPSRAMESIPKLGIYAILAACRQKLHESVLKDWLSIFVKDVMNKHSKLDHSSKNHINLDTNVVSLWV